MFFQIISPDTLVTRQSSFETALVFVLLGIAFTVFVFLRVSEYLHKTKQNKLKFIEKIEVMKPLSLQ